MRNPLGVFGFSLVALWATSCAIVATRPVQEMSYTAAAIKAAKEVQADTLAPDLYRQANEWSQKARHEYKFKNFKLALEYTQKARGFAEQAEFEALRNDGTRTSLSVTDQGPQATPYVYPTPTGTPIEDLTGGTGPGTTVQDTSKTPTPQATFEAQPPGVTTGFPNGAANPQVKPAP